MRFFPHSRAWFPWQRALKYFTSKSHIELPTVHALFQRSPNRGSPTDAESYPCPKFALSRDRFFPIFRVWANNLMQGLLAEAKKWVGYKKPKSNIFI